MAKVVVCVSMPKGKTLPDFQGILGQLSIKKNKATGVELRTKKGGRVFTMALNYTRLESAIRQFPELKAKDKRTGDTVVWLTGFEKEDAPRY
jgi:hypothetical protein